MQEVLNYIRKRPGMYIGNTGNGSNEQNGIYTLLKIAGHPLVSQFRNGCREEIVVDILDDKTVTISDICKLT